MSEKLKSINYLKESLKTMGEEELRRTLTYLIKVYVLDRTTSSGSSAVDKKTPFFDLISNLKREYRAPELDMFQLEAGKVFLEVDNRRIELTKEEGTVPSPVMPPPTMEPTPVGTPAGSAPTNNQDSSPAPSEGSSDEAPQRFRSLEF